MERQFKIASHIGDLKELRCLHKKNPTLITARSLFGWTPLHQASSGGHLDVVKWLHEQDPTLISVRDHGRWTPLHLASYHGHLDVVKWLHEQDPTLISVRINDGRTPLHVASSGGHLDMVKWFYEKNPTLINVRDEYGDTALHLAYRGGNDDVLMWLFTNNPSFLNDVDSAKWIEVLKLHKEFPLHFAARDGQLNRVKKFLNEEPNIIHQKDIWGMTPLHHLSACNNPEIASHVARLLLEADGTLISEVDNEEKDIFDMIEKCDQLLEAIQLCLINFLSGLLTDE